VAGALSQDKLAAAVQEETRMAEQDLTEADRLVAKNSVEEYIYDIRQRSVCIQIVFVSILIRPFNYTEHRILTFLIVRYRTVPVPSLFFTTGSFSTGVQLLVLKI
jgi:hypothetical protein